MRDELTFRASDKNVAPDSPIQLQKGINDIQKRYYKQLNPLKYNSARDELSFSASDNDDTPESPILLPMKTNRDCCFNKDKWLFT